MHWIWFRSNKLKIKSWSFHDSYSPHDWSIDVENTTLIDCASSILCNVMSLSNFPVRVFFTKGTSSENHLIFCLPSKSECNVVRTAADAAFRRFEWFSFVPWDKHLFFFLSRMLIRRAKSFVAFGNNQLFSNRMKSTLCKICFSKP